MASDTPGDNEDEADVEIESAPVTAAESRPSTASTVSRASIDLWLPVCDMLQTRGTPGPSNPRRSMEVEAMRTSSGHLRNPLQHCDSGIPLSNDRDFETGIPLSSSPPAPAPSGGGSFPNLTVQTVGLHEEAHQHKPTIMRTGVGFRPMLNTVDSPADSVMSCSLSSPGGLSFATPSPRDRKPSGDAAPPSTPASSFMRMEPVSRRPSRDVLASLVSDIIDNRATSFPSSRMRPMQAGAGTANMDEETSLMRVLFGSIEAAEDEDSNVIRVENHWMNPYLVHPDSSKRHRWDLIAILLVIYTTFLLPARTAFLWEMWDAEQPTEPKETEWDYFKAMDLFIDIFFMCDVCFNFITGYYSDGDEDIVVMYGPMIGKRYLMGWFSMDVLASLPLDLMVMGSSSTLWKLPRVLKVLRLSRLLRLLRLSRMLRYAARFNIQDRLEISDFQVRIGKLVCAVIMFLHWSACIQWLVVAAQNYPEDSWASQQQLEFEPIFEKYSWSLFRAVSHMFCIGYGQTAPLNTMEAHTINLSVMLGASLFAMFVGIVTSLLIQTDAANADYTQKLDTVNRYMAHRRLPLDLRQRIRDSFEYRWKSQRIMDEASILDELPVSLRTDVTTYNCRTLLQNVPFFQNCEPGLIPTVVRMLAPTIFLTGDVIVRYGEFPTEVYFIQRGEVQIVLFSKVVTYLSQGSFFGEMAFMLPGKRRTADVHAVKDCELFSLKKDHLDNVLIHFPEVKAAMLRIAQHRNAYLDEFCKHTAPTATQLEEEIRETHMDTMMNKMTRLEETSNSRERRRGQHPAGTFFTPIVEMLSSMLPHPNRGSLEARRSFGARTFEKTLGGGKGGVGSTPSSPSRASLSRAETLPIPPPPTPPTPPIQTHMHMQAGVGGRRGSLGHGDDGPAAPPLSPLGGGGGGGGGGNVGPTMAQYRSRRSNSIHELEDLKHRRPSRAPSFFMTRSSSMSVRSAADTAAALDVRLGASALSDSHPPVGGTAMEPARSAYTTQWNHAGGSGMGFARPRMMSVSVHESSSSSSHPIQHDPSTATPQQSPHGSVHHDGHRLPRYSEHGASEYARPLL